MSNFIGGVMTKPVVCLLGDSTLDNLYWIREDPGTFEPKFAQDHCIEGILKEKLGDQYEIQNRAYDGFTTSNVLNGGDPGNVLSEDKANYLAARKVDFCGQYCPLTGLEWDVPKNSSVDHYVVLSVGGNDFRVLLGQPWKILGAIGEVQKRYLQIMDGLEKMGSKVKPILMFQYRTQVNGKVYHINTILSGLGLLAAAVNLSAFATFAFSVYRLARFRGTWITHLLGIGSLALLCASHRQLSLRVTKEILMLKNPGMAVFGVLLERLYAPVIDRALQKRIPIIDLPNKFDPSDAENYVAEIEPSQKGGTFIASQITDVVRNYESFQNDLWRSFKNWTVKAI